MEKWSMGLLLLKSWLDKRPPRPSPLRLSWQRAVTGSRNSGRGYRTVAQGGVLDSSAPCISAYRGGMIQTAEQYQFLHHTLALYAAQLPPETNP